MVVTFVSTIDSMTEDYVVRFVDRPGGYDIPEGPDDIRDLLKACFRSSEMVEITYEASSYEILDARPVDR